MVEWINLFFCKIWYPIFYSANKVVVEIYLLLFVVNKHANSFFKNNHSLIYQNMNLSILYNYMCSSENESSKNAVVIILSILNLILLKSNALRICKEN